MRKLHIITVQPIDLLFNWTLRVQLTNFRKHGFLSNYTALIWISKDKMPMDIPREWRQLEKDFPEVEFVYYYDHENYLKIIQAFGYIPLLRPHCLRRHFLEYPELSKEAIFYIDADVILSKSLDLSPFLNDDVCYLSQAGSYINADYFDSKIKDVLPEKAYSYKEVDVLDKLGRQVGISREIAERNNSVSGAAQYLLKNIDGKFWADVEDACMLINVYLSNINKKFFESEDKGFQRWCADIWAVLWNIWKRGMSTECPPELDFNWATDPVEKWLERSLYHDAGAIRGSNLFNKRESKYINNLTTPFNDDLSWVDKNFCSSKYVEAIKEASPKQ